MSSQDKVQKLVLKNIELTKENSALKLELETFKEKAVKENSNVAMISVYKEIKTQYDRKLVDMRHFLTHLSKEVEIKSFIQKSSVRIKELLNAKGVCFWYSIGRGKRMSDFDEDLIGNQLRDYFPNQFIEGTISFTDIFSEERIMEKIKPTEETYSIDLGNYEMRYFKGAKNVYIGVMINILNELQGIVLCEIGDSEAVYNDKEFFELLVHITSDLLFSRVVIGITLNQSKNMEKAAMTDELTGLPTRRAWIVDLNEMGTIREPLSVIVIDCDYFKKINDDYGHAVGDEVLISIGRMLQERMKRINGKAYRIGGDEYVCWSYDEEKNIEKEMVEYLDQINAYKFSVGEKSFSVGLSIGISHKVKELELGKKWADYYQNECKKSGRNNVKIGESRDFEPLFEEHQDVNRYK